jgi:hypothetical protein
MVAFAAGVLLAQMAMSVGRPPGQARAGLDVHQVLLAGTQPLR